MLSKNQIKLIRSLSQKKFRNKHKLFVVEGLKGVKEFLNSDFELESLFTTLPDFEVEKARAVQIKEQDLKKLSFLKTPQEVLAVFKIPAADFTKISGVNLILDGVRDPGNLGTIIRLCDWFGVENLICSHDSVDCFNPKVVQASMGSLARVSVCYVDLPQFIEKQPGIPVYGAFLEGRNIYSEELKEPSFIIMGNEANGISPEVEELVTEKINIPQFGNVRETESLNVAMATSIILSEFKRGAATGK